jgi:SAM-dependent methyltransferase
MSEQPQTWHYGIVARHWAEFHVGGPEIPYYRKFIESSGPPALDVACGTGRLLLPYLRAGLDVDGCDISADMLALCQEKAQKEGFSPGLFAQPSHDLDLPRRYRTILMCGSFGIGNSRQQDLQALERFHRHLEPGGTLLVDHAMPYGASFSWQWEHWLKENRANLDPDWWPEGEFEHAADGSDYRLRARIADLDSLGQVLTMQMRAELWRDGQLVEEELHTLTQNIYFKNELVMMLEKAGFEVVAVQGDYTETEATRDHETLVFIARRES